MVANQIEYLEKVLYKGPKEIYLIGKKEALKIITILKYKMTGHYFMYVAFYMIPQATRIDM